MVKQVTQAMTLLKVFGGKKILKAFLKPYKNLAAGEEEDDDEWEDQEDEEDEEEEEDSAEVAKTARNFSMNLKEEVSVRRNVVSKKR